MSNFVRTPVNMHTTETISNCEVVNMHTTETMSNCEVGLEVVNPCLICEDSGGDILQTVTSVKYVGKVLNARLTEFPVTW